MRESGSEGRPGTDFAAEEHHMPHVRKQNAPQTDRQTDKTEKAAGPVGLSGPGAIADSSQPFVGRLRERERDAFPRRRSWTHSSGVSFLEGEKRSFGTVPFVDVRCTDYL